MMIVGKLGAGPAHDPGPYTGPVNLTTIALP